MSYMLTSARSSVKAASVALLSLDMTPSKVYTLIAEGVSGRLTPPASK